MEQAEDLFSIDLDYHRDRCEVLYKIADAKEFCKAWDTATVGKSWSNCSLAFSPTANATLSGRLALLCSTSAMSLPQSIRHAIQLESLDQSVEPGTSGTAPLLYGVKEYLGTLDNISFCAVNYVEDAAGCAADASCMWKPILEAGVCMTDWKGVVPQTTVAGAVFSVVDGCVPRRRSWRSIPGSWRRSLQQESCEWLWSWSL